MLVLIVLSGNNPLAKWKNYKAKGFNLKSQHKKVITDGKKKKKKTSDIQLYEKALFKEIICLTK